MKRSIAARSSIHQRLDLLVAGAAVECLLQRVFGGAQGVLRIGNVAVLEAYRHLPKPCSGFGKWRMLATDHQPRRLHR